MTNEELTAIKARHERYRASNAAKNIYEPTHVDRAVLLAEVEQMRAERDEIMRQFAIESDESLTECVVRNIDGWKQRALKAEKRE